MKNISLIILVAIISAGLAGGGVYWWQINQKQIDNLQNQDSDIKNEQVTECDKYFNLQTKEDVKEYIKLNIECKNTETSKSLFNVCEDPIITKVDKGWKIFCWNSSRSSSMEATVTTEGKLMGTPIFTTAL